MDVETADTGVVADKSWVRAPGAEFRAIARRHVIFFPDILLYELVTTAPTEMAICFKNLRDVEASLVLLPGLGELLRYEIAYQRPCTPVYERRLGRVSINPKTGESDFRFTKEQIAVIEEGRSEREVNGVQDFKAAAAATHGFFPDLKSLHQGGPRTLIDEIQGAVATDSKMVRDLYGAIRSPGMPAPDKIDEGWAFYRNMQVNLVAGLDFIWRYGPGNDSVVSKKPPNQCLDLEYLTIALLAGGIATKEGRLQEWFKLLRPGGIVLPCLPTT